MTTTITINEESCVNIVTYKKNGFRRIAQGAYKPRFIDQIEGNIKFLSIGSVKEASMVRQHARSTGYMLRVGLGKKNEYVENDWHSRDEYCDFATIEDAMDGLRSLLEFAKAGEFDEALDALLAKRQKHAFKMIEARQHNGQEAVDVRFLAAAE